MDVNDSKFNNMTCLKNGMVFVGKHFVKADLFFDEKIGEIKENKSAEKPEYYIVPGFVDIHTHGAVGGDFSDGKPEDIPKMLDYYASCGVTSLLPTTMTLSEQEITRAIRTISLCDYSGGAKIAGINIEGPFLSSEKNGAQASFNIKKPDISMFDRLYAACGGIIKLVTLACEEEGAEEFIRHVSRKCVVSLGHSAADYDTAMSAYKSGASHATHLFNAMSPLAHRQPGIVGAAFDSNASVELICDGLHIHPAVVRMVFGMFADRVNLISDSLRCSGMPEGVYPFGGQEIELKNGKACVKGTDTLAGSTISVADAVRNLVSFGIPLETAVYAASTAPADAIGCGNIGRLKAGACADIVVLNKQLEITAVYIDGRRIGRMPC